MVPGSQKYMYKFSSALFEDNDIIKIIKHSIPKGTLAWWHTYQVVEDISYQVADLTIQKPLSIIFSNCKNHTTFPDSWKKSNICPIHKKGDKQVINNYRPVSLLPICGKIFERLIFNSLL